MKFNLPLIATALAATFFSTVHAQTVAIGYPADGVSVSPGSEVTVEVDRPNSLSGSTEVAVVLGFQSCASTGGCRPVTDGVYTVLYNGGYKPEYQQNALQKPPHQNFTVTIPSDAQPGLAQLGLIHVTLIGAALAPFLETRNITLNVV
ncbi:hypothetical protein H0H93_001128 [Arthromyces matolae]|nr:hypothetical protein H0H93_001128 [Arthromyces matolae]